MIVSFGRNFCMSPEETRAVDQLRYAAAVTKFRTDFPEVAVFTAWNEPNQKDQGYRTKPYGSPEDLAGARVAGRRFRILEDMCNQTDNCKVLAGDLLDSGLTKAWLDAYKSKSGADLVGKKHVWAYHPYSDVHDLAPRDAHRTRAFVKGLAPGSKVWLDEAGASITGTTCPRACACTSRDFLTTR